MQTAGVQDGGIQDLGLCGELGLAKCTQTDNCGNG